MFWFPAVDCVSLPGLLDDLALLVNPPLDVIGGQENDGASVNGGKVGGSVGAGVTGAAVPSIGDAEGLSDGFADGLADGVSDGLAEGETVGRNGACVGANVGFPAFSKCEERSVRHNVDICAPSTYYWRQ